VRVIKRKEDEKKKEEKKEWNNIWQKPLKH
jgi:hypothetical protein